MEIDPVNPQREELPEPKPEEEKKEPKSPEIVPEAPADEAKRDDSFIGQASNEEMFAFSQDIAQGGNIAKTVDKIEKAAQVEKESELEQQKDDMVKAQKLA